MHISKQSFNELNYVSSTFSKKNMKGKSFLYSAELCREQIMKQNWTRERALWSQG